EQAAAWLLRLNDPACSDDDRRAFDAWLGASERHAEEYRRFQHLWRRLDGIPVARSAGRSGRIAAFAAVFALGIGLLIGKHWNWPVAATEETFATAVGETRQIVLADGTTVDLNTDSRLVATIDAATRRVRVERGEALFAVADDPARSFEVRAGAGVLRDIGTTFDVALAGEHVTVGVIEGAVEVRLPGSHEKAVIGGGERIAYSPAGLSPPGRFDGEAATAWRSGRFVFREMPLSEVVAQLNRHHERRTVLADARLARLRVSGAFRIAERDGLLTAIEALYPVRREEAGAETRLVPQARR
ncbi:MAG: FecR domain-containing protein, partial [Novosphingobium sp.]|nr:FecR domain-containing protein [Novosphingobium sp.]